MFRYVHYVLLGRAIWEVFATKHGVHDHEDGEDDDCGGGGRTK